MSPDAGEEPGAVPPGAALRPAERGEAQVALLAAAHRALLHHLARSIRTAGCSKAGVAALGTKQVLNMLSNCYPLKLEVG